MGQRSRKRRRQPPTGGQKGTVPARPPRKSSEERNAEIREGLEPLQPGERPTAVTVGAIVATLMTVANVVAPILGADFQGDAGNAVASTVFTTAILAGCAGGMWKAKYWAVLGFQTILMLQLLILCLVLIRVETLLQAALVTLGIALLGTMFWKLIRAMARIQMPKRPGT